MIRLPTDVSYAIDVLSQKQYETVLWVLVMKQDFFYTQLFTVTDDSDLFQRTSIGLNPIAWEMNLSAQ